TIRRDNGSTGITSVDYGTGGGTAIPGLDYTGVGGTIAFADGQNVNSFAVSILPDNFIEPNETFLVTLSNPTGGATLSNVVIGTVTILNHGGVPSPGNIDTNFNPGSGA